MSFSVLFVLDGLEACRFPVSLIPIQSTLFLFAHRMKEYPPFTLGRADANMSLRR